MPEIKSRGGRKGRSGPPGNLNAARNGYHVWRRRRALPAHLSHIRAFVEAEEEAIIRDKGGLDAVTASELALIRDAGTALGLVLLALEEARTKGAVKVNQDGSWDLQAGLLRVKGLLDTRRGNLLALGLERRSKDVIPISEQVKRLRSSSQRGGDGSAAD